MQEKKEDIKYIQNTVWMMYKSYLADHDMKEYNRKMGELCQKYYDRGDEQLLTFCQHLLITWTPIISGFAEDYYNAGRAGVQKG